MDMIQKIHQNEYGQIIDKLDKKYYPEPMAFDKKKSDKDFERASSGYVDGTGLTEPIKDEKGNVVWDMTSFDFLGKEKECPATVHPNLWRMEQLNNKNGIFQVYPHANGIKARDCKIENASIYQVRSYDLATMSIVRSQNGWIIIDPLTGSTTAAYAWEKFKEVMKDEGVKDEDLKIKAIIITHSHVDHYKGVDALLHAQHDSSIMKAKQADFEVSNKRESKHIGIREVLVLAPEGFYDESISENLYLGNCMSRRAQYMYGGFLPRGVFGTVGSGLGKTVSDQAGSIPVPSFEIKENVGEDEVKLMIDGLTITFKNVPGTEAPAEMHVYFDDYQTLCPGENITQTMHNLLTPRGAKVRDPKAFAEAIDDAINRFPETNIIIGTHHWPTWNEMVEFNNTIVAKNYCRDLMEKQRDMYLFFNNQVIHLLNSGYNMEEIANNFKLPTSLMNEYFNRGYYGTLNHDAKAVVQRYIGWWDGNPANYFKYTDEEVAERFVEDMGGADEVLKKAKKYFEKHDYRWTVELTKQLVFADPSNKEARELEADALEQLAYSFEAGTWRNIFLSGAFELRGMPEEAEKLKKNREGIVAGIRANLKTLQGIYIPEYLSILIDGYKAADSKVKADCIIGKYDYHFDLSNGVLHYKLAPADTAEYTQHIAQEDYTVFATEEDFANYLADYLLNKNGQYANLNAILSYVEIQDTQWNIIEPIDVNRQTELNVKK